MLSDIHKTFKLTHILILIFQFDKPKKFSANVYYHFHFPMWVSVIFTTVYTWKFMSAESSFVFKYVLSDIFILSWHQNCLQSRNLQKPSISQMNKAKSLEERQQIYSEARNRIFDEVRLESICSSHQISVDNWYHISSPRIYTAGALTVWVTLNVSGHFLGQRRVLARDL